MTQLDCSALSADEAGGGRLRSRNKRRERRLAGLKAGVGYSDLLSLGLGWY